jgi:CRAL/TRIO domain
VLARCVCRKEASNLRSRKGLANVALAALLSFTQILVRMSAFHICHPPTFFKLIFPILKLFLGERLRKRIRVHSGDEEHVNASLVKLGLNNDILPSDLGGEVVLDFKNWLQERAAKGL